MADSSNTRVWNYRINGRRFQINMPRTRYANATSKRIEKIHGVKPDAGSLRPYSIPSVY